LVVFAAVAVDIVVQLLLLVAAVLIVRFPDWHVTLVQHCVLVQNVRILGYEHYLLNI